jgi:hypothetical protein
MSKETVQKIEELMVELKEASTMNDGSVLLHRFLCHHDFLPKSALEYALIKWGKVMVWGGEAVRATGKGPAQLWKVFSPTHEIGLTKSGWRLSVNKPVSGDDVVPSPGCIRDGTIIYGLPPRKVETTITIVTPPPLTVDMAPVTEWQAADGRKSNVN